MRSTRQGAKAPFKTKKQEKRLQNYYKMQKPLKNILTYDKIKSEKESKVNNMENTTDKSYYTDEIENNVAVLYKEGWRSNDKEEMKAEFELNDEWTDAICKKLKEYERIDKND